MTYPVLADATEAFYTATAPTPGSDPGSSFVDTHLDVPVPGVGSSTDAIVLMWSAAGAGNFVVFDSPGDWTVITVAGDSSYGVAVATVAVGATVGLTWELNGTLVAGNLRVEGFISFRGLRFPDAVAGAYVDSTTATGLPPTDPLAFPDVIRTPTADSLVVALGFRTVGAASFPTSLAPVADPITVDSGLPVTTPLAVPAGTHTIGVEAAEIPGGSSSPLTTGHLCHFGPETTARRFDAVWISVDDVAVAPSTPTGWVVG